MIKRMIRFGEKRKEAIIIIIERKKEPKHKPIDIQQ